MTRSSQGPTIRGLKLPHDMSDDAERYSEREYEETPDRSESREVSDEVEKDATEEAENFEGHEENERLANEAAEEFDELESKRRELEDLAEEAAKEFDEKQQEKSVADRESFEDDLENDLDEVRDELHDEYVNDMTRQLEGGSRKDSEVEEGSDDGTTSEVTETSESYEDAGTGMVYTMETKGECENASEVEDEKEVVENSESHKSVDGVEESPDDGFRNRISRQETPDVEQGETTPSESVEDMENRVVQQPESNELTESSEPETSKVEPQHDDHPELRQEDVEDSDIEGELETDEAPETQSDVATTEEVQEFPDDSEEVTEPEIDEIDPETPEVESSETSDQDVSEHSEEEFLEVGLDDDIPEEFISRVEELVERLEESDTEPKERIIVEALTGEPVVDRTLEPRSFFGDDEETSEEEEIRKRLRELFGELSEEEREQFKEIVRSRLKSEEDLEELIARHPTIRLSPDYRQKLEAARSFVKRKRKGQAPKIIRELWALEAEREWMKVVGESLRRSVERSLRRVSQDAAPKVKKKRKVKRKPGYHKRTQREIKLHRPMTGKRPVASFERYKKWLEENHPAVCERRDYPVLLESVRMFFELRKALRRRKTIRQHELEDLGREIGIAPGTAIDWGLYGQSAHLFQIVASSFSKREGLRLKTELLRKTDGIDAWSELERRLQEVYPGGTYRKISNYSEKKSRVKEFFIFLGFLERGGTKKGIARASGISQRRIRAFFDGELPWLLRHVLAKTGKLSTSKRYRYHKSSTYKVKIRPIKVRGKEVSSYSEFRTLVERDFPWLKERPDYSRLLHVVRVYFKARRKFGKKHNATRKEIVEFAENNDVSHQTVIEWIVGRSQPMAQNLLDNSLSITEARMELDAILKKLNGVENLEEYRRRMKTFYLIESLKSRSNYRKEYELVKEFFRFLDALKKGGLFTDIVNRGILKLSTTKQRRLYHRFPKLISIAASIPRESPTRGHKWIPLKINKRGLPQNYIEVPSKIHRVSDLDKVLGRLSPLKTKRMKDRIKRFGDIPRLIAFMYLLGALVSDGSFGRRDGISTRTRISLSAEYAWSETFGEAFCYCLGLFGIKAGRIKNSVRKNECGEDIEMMNWSSSASPIFLWIRNSLLGLYMDAPKNEQPIRAEWIHQMPEELIVPFLQGLADGDGYASVRSLNAGIGTKHNKEFIQRLLSQIGIDSIDEGTGIEIHRKESLQIVSQLPLFRYANSRQFRLNSIIEMISSMKWTKVSDKEREKILEYHREGFNANQIGPLLYAEFGKARRSGTIQKVIKDHNA
jgi:hypothetical protein